MSSANLYIGLMSGTSADGIDLALVDFSCTPMRLVSQYYLSYNHDLRQRIQKLYNPSSHELDQALVLDVELAQIFALAIQQFLQKEKLKATDITAIGNHGQTIRHRPNITSEITSPFTWQIGCNQTLATLTNIRVIGDFRRKDMILGGQGAPLVPAFHQALFPAQSTDVFVVNIGGIANITYLPKAPNQNQITGFDTGPGNALMDDWFHQHHQNAFYDHDGNWARSGKVDQTLLNSLLTDPYFKTPAPKSSGREYFNQAWLSKHLPIGLSPQDIQATLTALTAHSIAQAIEEISDNAAIYLCGGGALNSYLIKLLQHALSKYSLQTTQALGINSDALEAMAFAWFAYAFDHQITGNIPAVTGARKACVLGINYPP